MVDAKRGHQRADRLKAQSQTTSQSDHTDHSLSNSKPCRVGPPRTDGSWWRGLTEWGPLEKGMANHFRILALRTPYHIDIDTNVCVCVCVCVCVEGGVGIYILNCFSCVWLFAIPWTAVAKLLCPWDSPGKNTRVGCYFLHIYTYIHTHASSGVPWAGQWESIPWVQTIKWCSVCREYKSNNWTEWKSFYTVLPRLEISNNVNEILI